MATTTNFGWETPDDTDLVKDGALAIRTLGSAIDTSLVDLKGGTTGQVLSKTSNTDMDFTWVTSDDANAIQNAIVDAKGDLIAASAADTPARLAVGNNGETLVADSSTSTGLRYNPQNALVNPVINGGMDIWQRGTSVTPAAGLSYTADRWQTYRNVTGYTVSRQSTGDTTNVPNIQYSARVQRTAGNTATDTIFFTQSIETANTIPYAGKTLTFSYYARAGANYSAASSILYVKVYTGTGTDQNMNNGYTGVATPVDTTITLTTTWQRFTHTFTLGSTVTEFGPYFYYVPVGTAGANDWVEITGVQFDIGTYTASSAPTFRRAGGNIAGEYLACARYYQKSYDLATAPGTNTNTGLAYGAWSAAAVTTGYLSYEINYLVRMRTAPTVTTYLNTGTSGQVERGTPGSSGQAVTPSSAFNSEARILIQSPSGNSHAGLALHYTASAEL